MTTSETASEGGAAYLLAELSRLDALLRYRVAEWRAETESDPASEFSGLYVSDAEVDRLLGTDRTGRTGATYDSAASRDGTEPRDRTSETDDARLRELEARSRDLRAHRLRGAEAERSPRFVELGERFGLSREHLDVLLAGIAPSVDPKYERIYGYLQDDVTARLPTVDLICRLLRHTSAGRLAARRLFGPTSPLVAAVLIRLSPADGRGLGSRTVCVDDRVVAFLAGGDDVATPFSDAVTVTRPGPDRDAGLASLELEESVERAVERLVERDHDDDHRARARDESVINPLLAHFYGPYGAGATAAVEASCLESGRTLLTVDARELLADVRGTVPMLAREARLQGRRTALHVRGVPVSSSRPDRARSDPLSPESASDAGDVTGADAAPIEAELLRALDEFGGRVFLTGRKPLSSRRLRRIERHDVVELEFPRPSYDRRKRLWRRVARDLPGTELDPAALATAFRLTSGEIDDALAAAEREARAAGDPLDAERIFAACRAQSRGALDGLARRVEPTYAWDDIVLPRENRRHLREVAAQINHRETVYADWGFEERFSLGKGLLVLFTGPSGTGKTMAAEVLANDAGLDLYKVDLSQIVDKYVGETEKNLGRVFDGAAGTDAVLLFDEADALFGERSDVTDAHDRYANIEVNYLLQRVEEHDGTVVLTTNLRKNMDEAFMRRIHLRVDFPFPDEPVRRAIWEAIFPAVTPVADLDFDFLATLSMAGGNIKNAALTAAFLAAEDGGPVEMRHVVCAVRREFQKTGTLVERDAFGDYRELLDCGPASGAGPDGERIRTDRR